MDIGVTFFNPTMGVMLITLIYRVIPVVLLCFLQYFLSKMESPWPGRVLPILSGVNALLFGGMLLLSLAPASGVNLPALLFSVFLLFVPMVLYIIIYRHTRQNLITKKNMNKMNIQDLE